MPQFGAPRLLSEVGLYHDENNRRSDERTVYPRAAEGPVLHRFMCLTPQRRGEIAHSYNECYNFIRDAN
jgi:hypothetical protein